MARSKKISTKSTNKESAKKVRVTAKQLRSLAKSFRETQKSAIEKLLQEDFDTLAQAKRELKKNTVQVKRTTKSVKKLAKVFRDAFGKFSGPTTSPKKSASKKPQKKTPVKQVPKKGRTSVGVTSREIEKQIRDARKNLQSEKVTAKPSKSKAVFSTRTLRGRSGETTLQLFDRLQSMGDSPDALLKPGERWMFTYGKGRAKSLYGTFQQAVTRMQEYELSQGLLDGNIDPSEDDIEEKLVTSIKIMKTSVRPKNYADKKEAEERMRAAERKRIQRRGRSILKESGIEVPSVFGGSVDIVDALSECT